MIALKFILSISLFANLTKRKNNGSAHKKQCEAMLKLS